MIRPIEELLSNVDFKPCDPPRDNPDGLPYMTHTGVLKIGDNIELPCAVLSNGQRIFYGDSIEEMMTTLGNL